MIKGGDIVSEGTLKTEDLLWAFSTYLQAHGHIDESMQCEIGGLLTKTNWSDADFETAGHLVNEDLWGALDELAPDGHYFGTHPGDAALFGYWSISEMDSQYEDI